MSKLQRGWDLLRNRTPGETIANRDVYNDQQFERTTTGKKKNMNSRILLNIAMTIFFFFVSWLFVSLVSKGFAGIIYTVMPGNPEGAVSFGFSFGKFFICVVLSTIFYGVMYLILRHNLDVENALDDNGEINTYANDQHIALPEELQEKFDWFPDVGATSDVQVSSMISHMALVPKGLHPVQFARRAEKDIVDEDGDVVTYKGEVLRDGSGDIVYDTVDMIDTKFMHDLYTASGMPMSKDLRKFYAPGLIKYNPDGTNRDKLGKFATVADLINADWKLPYYEPQRPAGAYIVDTAPVNTMV